MRLLIQHRLRPRFHAQKLQLHCLSIYIVGTLNCMICFVYAGRERPTYLPRNSVTTACATSLVTSFFPHHHDLGSPVDFSSPRTPPTRLDEGMLLAVFTLQLHLTYPISAGNMSATIYTTHPLPKPAVFVAVSVPHVHKHIRKIPPSWTRSAIALRLLYQPTPLSAENSRGHQVLGRWTPEPSCHHGMEVPIRPIALTLWPLSISYA